MNSARQYVLLSVGLAILAAGGINLVVDPYNRFGFNRLGVYISAERESKSVQVLRYPHDALLLGNSRIAMIPAVPLEGFHFFNGAFGAASSEEIYYFINRFARKERLVLLGVDLGQFDPSELKGDIFEPPGWGSSLDHLLNLRTAEYSLRTIGEHWSGQPAALRADGSFDPTGWFALFDRDDPAAVNLQLERLRHTCASYRGPPKDGWRFYRRIAERLKGLGIPCVVVVPPVHEVVARQLQTEAAEPARAAYRAWLSELRTIFPYVVDLSFSSYGAAENFFKADPVHFKPDVGVRMLNEQVIPVALEAVGAPPVLEAAKAGGKGF